MARWRRWLARRWWRLAWRWRRLAWKNRPVRALRASELGATGQQRAIAMIDLETAQLHATFGFLLVLGLVLAATIR